ncbi:MAG TPA: NAD(P)H-binding protein [Actinomycetes bacterium]|jgi:uncharacterized protein YbjT (DUF2867 family)|nr:NAD(P)H-binding protein [Actinomycetes bacterium]
MILVTGATGNAGGAVLRALVSAGEQVRGLIRREADQARLPASVEGVTGDLNRPQTLWGPLSGVRAVFLLSGYQGLPDALAEMRNAGVERVVLLSSSAAPNGDLSNAVARYHILSEQAVRESGLPFTFLQPNSFMSNTFQWAPQLRAGDVVRAPFADIRVAMIDPDDLGAVAAQALISAAHEGRSYRLSGPESLLPADRVAVLARVLGRELRFEAQSNAEARVEMSATMPPEYVDAFFSFFVDGTLDESKVLPTVREVTGRPPHSFEQWAVAHADAFRTSGTASR